MYFRHTHTHTHTSLAKLFAVCDDSVAATLSGEAFLEQSYIFLILTNQPANSRPLIAEGNEDLNANESAEIYGQS